MAEILVRDEFDQSQLNVCIVRPSIVTPAWKEPTPGWVDSLDGMVGVITASGKGLLRTMMCEGKFKAQIIPVDQVVAGIIAIAHNVGSKKERAPKISVFNVTCSGKKLITYKTMLEKLKRIGKIYPVQPGLSFPIVDITMNPIKHYFTMIFTMWLPALIIDLFLMITLQPRFMIRIQKKIFDKLSVLHYFTTREWIFSSENFKEVFRELSKEEQKIFNMNTEEIDEEEYFKSFIHGVRKYQESI